MTESYSRLQLTPSQIHRLGRVFYDDGLYIQRTMASHVKEGHNTNQILILEHNSVFTIGRNSSRKDIHVTDDFLGKHCIEVHNTDRGGQVTYHGPGQIIVYPICNLKSSNMNVRDIVYCLEETMICTAADFNVQATRLEGLPGVWVKTIRGPEKIGSLGLHVHHSITTHGLAFNVEPNLTHFKWITPCGITDKGVCSLRSLLGDTAPTVDQTIERMQTHLVRLLKLKPYLIQKRVRNSSVFLWRRKGVDIEFLMLQYASNKLWTPNISCQPKDRESTLSAAQNCLKKYVKIANNLVPTGLVHTYIDKNMTKLQPTQTPIFSEEVCFYTQLADSTHISINNNKYLQSRWCNIQEVQKLITERTPKTMIALLNNGLRQDTTNI